MSRAKWKGPVISNKNLGSLGLDDKTIIFKRNIEIMPINIGLVVNIPCGNKLVKLTISKEMVGHKAGEFVPTKEPASFKKKKK